MDAVGEPHLLEILLEGLPFGCSAVAAVVRVNRLQCPAYGKIVFEILVEDDIPSAQGGLVEVVDEFLLVKGEVLEAGYFVLQYFDVVERIHYPFELLRLYLLLRLFQFDAGGCP